MEAFESLSDGGRGWGTSDSSGPLLLPPPDSTRPALGVTEVGAGRANASGRRGQWWTHACGLLVRLCEG